MCRSEGRSNVKAYSKLAGSGGTCQGKPSVMRLGRTGRGSPTCAASFGAPTQLQRSRLPVRWANACKQGSEVVRQWFLRYDLHGLLAYSNW